MRGSEYEAQEKDERGRRQLKERLANENVPNF